MLLQTTECLFLRDAGIGHTIHVVLQQVPLILRSIVTIIGNTFVVRMSHQIHDILFEVCAGAGDNLNLVLTNHLCQRDAQLSGTHRTPERNHHFAPLVEMGFVTFGRIHQSR